MKKLIKNNKKKKIKPNGKDFPKNLTMKFELYDILKTLDPSIRDGVSLAISKAYLTGYRTAIEHDRGEMNWAMPFDESVELINSTVLSNLEFDEPVEAPTKNDPVLIDTFEAYIDLGTANSIDPTILSKLYKKLNKFYIGSPTIPLDVKIDQDSAHVESHRRINRTQKKKVTIGVYSDGSFQLQN
jgi:hypothetical protein